MNNDKNSRKLTIIIVLAVFLFAAANYLLYKNFVSTDNADRSSDAEPSGSDNTELIAPDILCHDINGEEYLLSDHFGKPIIINFWATWCHYCVEELPYFQKKYEEYSDRIDFVMLNITNGYGETPEAAAEFFKKNGYTLPIYFDSYHNGAISYEISSLPTTVTVDPKGNICEIHYGALSEEKLQEAIDTLLESTKKPRGETGENPVQQPLP